MTAEQQPGKVEQWVRESRIEWMDSDKIVREILRYDVAVAVAREVDAEIAELKDRANDAVKHRDAAIAAQRALYEPFKNMVQALGAMLDSLLRGHAGRTVAAMTNDEAIAAALEAVLNESGTYWRAIDEVPSGQLGIERQERALEAYRGECRVTLDAALDRYGRLMRAIGVMEGLKYAHAWVMPEKEMAWQERRAEGQAALDAVKTELEVYADPAQGVS